MNDGFDIENGTLIYFSGKDRQSVVVPDGVTALAENAFVANETVTEVVLPNGLTEIGESAFSSCKSLRKVTLPDTLEIIAEEAFYGCSALREIILPPSLTHIGESAFAYCESLEKIAIPSGVKTIGTSAFESCSQISELTLGEGIESIERDAFSDCKKISKLKIPDSVAQIGKGAFCACDIKELVLPDGVTSVGRDAFHNCERLERVYIGSGVREIGAAAFGYCAALAHIETAKDNEFFVVKGNCLIDIKNKTLLQALPDFDIPTDGSVTVIADGAFGGMKSLKSFEVPACIEKIENYAFSDCERLRRLTVHRDNKCYVAANDCIIETAAGTLVAGCNPSEIPSDGSVKIIASGAFTDNGEIISLNVPEGVTEMQDFAFSGFSSLGVVRLPDSLVSLGDSAFMDCEKLRSVTFGKNIKKIGDWCFAGCTALTETEFPESLRFIGNNAFYRVPLVRAEFRAPKGWVMRDWNQTTEKVKLKNPKKTAALIVEKNSECSFEREVK